MAYRTSVAAAPGMRDPELVQKHRVRKMALTRLMSSFATLRPRIEALTRGRVGCSATAEDIVQDT